MGAPLAGTDVRAYVTTGGGLRLKGLTPRLRYRRLHMIFPLKYGPEEPPPHCALESVYRGICPKG